MTEAERLAATLMRTELLASHKAWENAVKQVYAEAQAKGLSDKQFARAIRAAQKNLVTTISPAMIANSEKFADALITNAGKSAVALTAKEIESITATANAIAVKGSDYSINRLFEPNKQGVTATRESVTAAVIGRGKQALTGIQNETIFTKRDRTSGDSRISVITSPRACRFCLSMKEVWEAPDQRGAIPRGFHRSCSCIISLSF